MRVKRCILKTDKYVCLKKRVRVKKGTERNWPNGCHTNSLTLTFITEKWVKEIQKPNLMHKNCKYCRQKEVCAGCNKVSLTGQACDHGPAAAHSPTPPSPILWPLGLRNEPGMNQEWTRSGAQFSEIFQKLPEPSHPSASASLSLCRPCNSWSGSESSAGPQREGQHRHVNLYHMQPRRGTHI